MTIRLTHFGNFLRLLLNLPAFLLCQNLYAGFPCDLKQLSDLNQGHLPDLILSGEFHSDFYCNVDKVTHASLADDGKILVAEEGVMFGKTSLGHTHVKGYDDPLTHGLGMLSKANFQILGCSSSNSEIAPSFLAFFDIVRENPILAHEWFEMRKAKPSSISTDEAEEQIFQWLDRYLDPLTPGIQVEAARDKLTDLIALPRNQVISNERLKKVFHQFAHSFINAYNSNYRKNYRRSAPMKEIHAKNFLSPLSIPLESSVKYKKWQVKVNKTFEYAFQFYLDLRNELMSDNIASLYCEAAEAKKPLLVIIGKSHLAGIKPILKKLSNHRVPIKVRHSDQACRAIMNSATPDETLKIIKKEYSTFSSSPEAIHDLITKLESIYYCLQDDFFHNQLVNLPEKRQMKFIKSPCLASQDSQTLYTTSGCGCSLF